MLAGFLARPLVHRAYLVGYVEGPATRAPHGSSRDPRGKFVASLATQGAIFRAEFCGSITAEVSGRGPEGVIWCKYLQRAIARKSESLSITS